MNANRFGCYADNCDADGRSLVGDLRTALHGFGIDTEVKGPDGPIIATPDGRKVKLDAPVPGSMNKDRHDVIVIEEDDALVGLMAGFRFQRHPLTSGLVLAGAGNDLTALTGVFKRGAEVDVDLFGHGERRDGKRLVGGRDAKALAKQIATLRDRLDLKVKKVHLFSCKSADCDETGRSMVDDMSDELRAQGIDARVKGHSGGIELTPDGRTIKSPTRQERSELTGGWDKIEMPKPAVSAVAVVAEAVPEKYVRRVIGIGDDSSEAYAMAMGFYEKYAKSAVVMERFGDAWLPTRASNGEKVDGPVKVQLVGSVRNGRIGNRDAGDVAHDVAAFHARYGGTIAKVALVDASPQETDATDRSLVDGISNKLHEIGIDTNVVGRNRAARVYTDGDEHAVGEGTRGSLGRDRDGRKMDVPEDTEGALGERLAIPESLAQDLRTMIANLDRLRDSDFVNADGSSKTPLSFRGDSRPPEQIFGAGFRPRAEGRDAHADLRWHQDYKQTRRSNLVSTSKGPTTAWGFAINNGTHEGWVYVLHGQKGLDVNQRRRAESLFKTELEVVVPDGVARELIVGAYKANTRGIVPGSFQPNPHFESRFDRVPLAARRDALVAAHGDAVRKREEAGAHSNHEGVARADQRLAVLEKRLGDVLQQSADGARREANGRDFIDPRRVVIVEEFGKDVLQAGDNLRKRDPDNTIVIAPNGNIITGAPFDKQNTPIDVEVVGHHYADGKIGKSTIEQIARQIADAKKRHGGEVASVDVVSCDSAACAKPQVQAALIQLREKLGGDSALVDGLESFLDDIGGHGTADDLARALRDLGIDVEVTGRDGPVLVDREGREHAVPEGTEGALGNDVDPDGLRLQIIMEDDAMMGMYAAYRQLRHPDNSLLVRPSAGAGLWSGVFKTGVPAYFELFGHGDPIRRLLGGYDGKTVAGYVATLRDRMNLKILKVRAITCMGTRCDENGRSFVGDLTGGLREHGIDAPVSGYDKRITVTKEGRVEPWGSGPRITFPPVPTRPTIARIPARAPVEAPKNPDKYVRRVIGIVGRSPDAYAAGLALYNKYGKRSVLMERPLGSWTPTRSSDGSRIDGNVKVQLVGEGKNGKLGNRDAQDLARDVAAFHATYGGKIAKVGLVSCNSNDCDATGKSLVDKVSRELHALGIDTNVVGRNGAVRVDHTGRKHAVPQGTPGSLGPPGPDLASAALPESMVPLLTPHERALLGNLHALDDSYFLGDDEVPLTRFLFRGDARDPAEIFSRGFEAWQRDPDAPTDLEEHQRGETKTNFVSLSKAPSVATGFANYMGLVSGRHVFVTRGQRGLDVNKRLPFSWQPDQYEIAVPDAVAPEMIVGAYGVGRKGIVAGSFRPNPRFEAHMDREGFAARQRSLLDRHAALSSALDALRGQWPWQREPGARAQLRRDRATVEKELQGLYREQEAAARRDGNRREFFDTTLKE